MIIFFIDSFHKVKPIEYPIERNNEQNYYIFKYKTLKRLQSFFLIQFL